MPKTHTPTHIFLMVSDGVKKAPFGVFKVLDKREVRVLTIASIVLLLSYGAQSSNSGLLRRGVSGFIILTDYSILIAYYWALKLYQLSPRAAT